MLCISVAFRCPPGRLRVRRSIQPAYAQDRDAGSGCRVLFGVCLCIQGEPILCNYSLSPLPCYPPLPSVYPPPPPPFPIRLVLVSGSRRQPHSTAERTSRSSLSPPLHFSSSSLTQYSTYSMQGGPAGIGWLPATGTPTRDHRPCSLAQPFPLVDRSGSVFW